MSEAARQLVEFVVQRLPALSDKDLILIALHLHRLLIEEYQRRKRS